MKKIAIIGSGLLGCLTAFKTAKKFPKYEIYLIDASNDILSSFKSIKMSNLKFNNGYHTLDINRCYDLYNFLKNKIKIRFRIHKTSRFLMINKYLISENKKINDYPLALKKNFLKKFINTSNINILYKSLSKNFQQLIKKTSKRYSNNLSDNLKHFIPWFLPKEYYLKSNDEGDIFRNHIRKNNKTVFLATPINGLFDSLSKSFRNQFMTIKNVKLMLKTKVFIEGQNIIFKKNDKVINLNFDYTFICTSSMILINSKKNKNYKKILTNPKYFVCTVISVESLPKINFSEIICLNKDFIELARISNIIKKNNKYFFLIELIFKNVDNLNKKINKIKLQKILMPIFKDQAKSLKIINYTTTRKMFFPKKSNIKNSTTEVQKLIKKISTKKNKVFCNINFGPINMAKAWIASDNNLKVIK